MAVLWRIAGAARSGRERAAHAYDHGHGGRYPQMGAVAALLACSAWQHGSRTLDRVRRQRPRAIAVLLTLLLASCSAREARRADQERLKAAKQQQERCRHDRRTLPPLLAAFARSEEQLAKVRAEVYSPSAAPPPLDADEQRRLAIYDQEVEQEQYAQAVAVWQEREWQRRSAWRAGHSARLDQAMRQRNARAAALRQQAPSLLTQSDPPRLIPVERDRRLSCGASAR